MLVWYANHYAHAVTNGCMSNDPEMTIIFLQLRKTEKQAVANLKKDKRATGCKAEQFLKHARTVFRGRE